MRVRGPVFPRQSLWKHMVEWHEKYGEAKKPVKLETGPWLVTDEALIKAILHDQANYVDESAFLRTRNFFPLPHDQRVRVLKRFIGLASPAIEQLPEFLDQQFKRPRTLRMQSDGIWLMYSLYKDRIFDPRRASDFNNHVEYYLGRKTVRDDVQGAFWRLKGKARDELDLKVGELLDQENHVAYDDLVTIVNDVELELLPAEKSELFLRLVQSLVAFTGAAFELAFYFLAVNPSWLQWLDNELKARAFILELQRLYPTAWRLTRTAARDHYLNGVLVAEGDEVILGHSVAQKSIEAWGRDSEIFDPERWVQQTQNRLLTFGAGPGVCPGKNIAIKLLTQAVLWVGTNVSELQINSPAQEPYVRSILAAPRAELNFHRK